MNIKFYSGDGYYTGIQYFIYFYRIKKKIDITRKCVNLKITGQNGKNNF